MRLFPFNLACFPSRVVNPTACLQVLTNKTFETIRSPPQEKTHVGTLWEPRGALPEHLRKSLADQAGGVNHWLVGCSSSSFTPGMQLVTNPPTHQSQSTNIGTCSPGLLRVLSPPPGILSINCYNQFAIRFMALPSRIAFFPR